MFLKMKYSAFFFLSLFQLIWFRGMNSQKPAQFNPTE